MKTMIATLAALVMTAGGPRAQSSYQLYKLLPSDAAQEDLFGFSLAVSGTTTIVGTPGNTDFGSFSGSAYLFDTTTGLEIAKLLASDGSGADRFGTSVGISGTTAIVGAYGHGDLGPRSGAAYLFDTTSGLQTAKLLAGDGVAGDDFGMSIALSGTTAIIGATGDDTGTGSAYLFDVSTGLEIAKLVPIGGLQSEIFGWSVAINGTTAIVGAPWDDDLAPNAGSAYLFDTTTGMQIVELHATVAVAQSHFGFSVGISGTTAIVGTMSGAAYLFDTTTGLQTVSLIPDDAPVADGFGYSVAIEGTTAIVGSHGSTDLGIGSGAAYLFDAVTGLQITKLLASDGGVAQHFGTAVATDGTLAIVGARADSYLGPNTGTAYQFSVGAGGINYCSSTPNSTGRRTLMSADGSPSLTANDLTLSAGPIPNQTYLFLHAGDQVQVPFGNGFLCASGNVMRLIPPQPTGSNVAFLALDLPSAGILIPGTYNFQCLYRDPAAGGARFNLSDGLAVTLVP